MREIKFRAWDKKEKRFIYLTVHPKQISWASPKFTSQKLLAEIDGDICAVSFNNIEGWQEYTGLKDKNEKEIYEGDILKNESESTRQFLIIVEFYAGRFVGKSFSELTGSHILNLVDWVDSGYRLGDDKFEIIGNIYENPELCK